MPDVPARDARPILHYIMRDFFNNAMKPVQVMHNIASKLRLHDVLYIWNVQPSDNV